MRGWKRISVAAMVVFSLGMAAASSASAKAGGFAFDPGDDGADQAPDECPYSTSSTGYIQGQMFSGLSIHKAPAEQAGSRAFYVPWTWMPLSDNKEWVWWNGGANYDCWKVNFILFSFGGMTMVPPSTGTLLPIPKERDPNPPEGEVLQGPVDHVWVDPGDRTGGGKIVCLMTDWYDGSGTYLDTSVDACWVE